MKWLVALVAVTVAFFAGHALATYRMVQLLSELQRSDALSDASILLRSVDVLDKGELSSLRVKLLAVAMVQIEPSPSNFWTWRSVVLGPFEDLGQHSLDWLREQSEHEAEVLLREFKRLCEGSAKVSPCRR